MASSLDIRQRAMTLVEQLPPEQLMVVVQLMEFLAQSGQQGKASSEELRDRSEWGELSEPEHQELIQYENLLEQQRVERLEALIKLAELKNVDLLTLNRQLLPPPTSYAV
jgi:hypothetical protein